MLKMKDLKNQTREELEAQVRDISKDIYDLKCEIRTARKLEKPHFVRSKKRDRARLLTAITELRQREA